MRVIVSGGGTGGHIFPAISIANEIKLRFPDAHILFVGAEGRMEMEKVPAAGYEIIGLPVSGFDRRHLLRNFAVLYRLVKSIIKARRIVRTFRPDVAIGVGGYASGPTLWAACHAGVPTLIQEQNGYAGVTNKMLASHVDVICVAYEGMQRFFPADKIVMTGNPVRQDLCNDAVTRDEAAAHFHLDASRKIILVIGGSLGARTINESVAAALPALREAGVQLIWQTGKAYAERARETLAAFGSEGICCVPFISRMDMAYKAADLVVSRAGAGSISELCLLGKPAILVPSPNVAEDHQTKNALALSSRGAALLVEDAQACAELFGKALALVADAQALHGMSQAAAAMAQHNSASRIVDEMCRIINDNNRKK